MSPDLHHLSGAYAVDALDRDERSAFESHLAQCDACRSEVAELSVAAHAMAVLTEAGPPASLRSVVLSGIAQVRPLPPLVVDAAEEVVHDQPALVDATTPMGGEAGVARAGATVIPLFRRTTTWIAAAAAAAVLAVGGVAAWSPWSSDQTTLSALQQVTQASDAATVTSHKGAVTATLAYSRELNRSALTVTGMPPAPDGRTYQLWYVGSNEVARSAGFITPGGDGRAEAVLAGSLTGATAVGVTVEPTGGSPAPTSDPIMVMAVA
ncbi:anti-sigma factor [Phycicoccus duodecadis]|uniref:Regulator of SigK n=1 Tax=Phycicoccus duodecadis TaxID=173053 RepID=A0A2N3YLB8_9MICO|nr:anti-sigma factor [Phycicoccus duodecadis]PKW27646.1 anti-sigma-K factor rskA [Phycicoccus duodecadis]